MGSGAESRDTRRTMTPLLFHKLGRVLYRTVDDRIGLWIEVPREEIRQECR